VDALVHGVEMVVMQLIILVQDAHPRVAGHHIRTRRNYTMAQIRAPICAGIVRQDNHASRQPRWWRRALVHQIVGPLSIYLAIGDDPMFHRTPRIGRIGDALDASQQKRICGASGDDNQSHFLIWIWLDGAFFSS